MKNIILKGVTAIIAVVVICVGSVFATEVADTTRPAITIEPANPKTIDEGGTVSYTISTNDNVGITAFILRKEHITMNGFTADVTITKTSAFVRTVTFTNVKSASSTANKYFTIAEGISRDEAGNLSKLKNSPAFTINEKVVTPPEEVKDTTIPAMTISAANPGKIYAGEKVVYTVSVSDNVAVTGFNLTASDITLKGFTANVSITGSGNVRTITFTNVQGTVGTGKYFVVAEGVAKDAAGNVTKQKNSPAFEIVKKAEESVIEEVKDTTRPALTISAANPGKIYAGQKVVYTVSVSDNVEVTSFNLTVADITLKEFTADISITGSGLTRTVTFTNVQGTVGTGKYFVVAEGVAKDAAGNVTKQKNSPAFEIIEKATEKPSEETPVVPEKKPTKKVQVDEYDDTPKTGAMDYSVLAGVISTLSLAGIVITKKYSK